MYKKSAVVGLMIGVFVFISSVYMANMYKSKYEKSENSIELFRKKELVSANHNIQKLYMTWASIRIVDDYNQLLPMYAKAMSYADVTLEILSNTKGNEDITSNLVEVSEFSYYMIQKLNNGDVVDSRDFEKIESVYNEIGQFVVYESSNDNTYKKDYNKFLGTGVYNIQTNLNSELKPIEPEKVERLTDTDGVIVVREYLKNIGVDEVYYLGYNKDVDTYSYGVKTDTNVRGYNLYIDIRCSDGEVVWFLRNDVVSGEIGTIEDAIVNGEGFLNNNGYGDMRCRYYKTYGDVIIVEFVKYENGVYVYPQNVVVKMSLIDGDVLGVVADEYIKNNTVRVVSDVVLSMKDAREYVSDNIIVESIKLIVNEYGVLCYEFVGRDAWAVDGLTADRFLVWINATSGKLEGMEKIE